MKETYVTSDLNLATSLMTAGFPMVEAAKGFRGIIKWHFEDTPELQAVVEQFFSDQLSLPVQKLFFNQRLLRGRMKDGS